jgi:hypothetical protein
MNGNDTKLTDTGIEPVDFYIYPEFYKIGSTMSFEDFLKTLNVRATIKSAFKRLSPEILLDTFRELEKSPGDRRVAVMFMNAYNYSEVRKFGQNLLDQETKRTELQKGHMAMTWGALIVVCIKVPVNTILFVSDEEFKDAVVLKICEDTNPKAQELIQYAERINELSKDIQSLCSKTSKLIHDAVQTVERN